MSLATSDLPVDTLFDRFLKYQERQQIAIRADEIPTANRHVMKVTQYADALAATPQGKDRLESAVNSQLPFVQLRAAQWVIDWAPEIAVPELGRLVICDFEPDISINERLELRISAKHTLYHFFGITSFDHNDLIEPLKAYGIDLPYRDHSAWQ